MSEAEKSLLARVAWLYYVQGLTQEQVGARLQFSRTKITRLLAHARNQGIVEIHINNQYRSCFEAEARLQKEYSLREIVVVPVGNTPEETSTGVGRAGARLLERSVQEGDLLAAGWGKHLYNMAQALREHPERDIRVVQLLGGLSTGRINPQAVLELITIKLGATGIWLNTPAVVDSREIRDALLSDEGVRHALEMGARADTAVMGIGDVTDQASLILSGAVSVDEMRELRDLGAVGDLLGWHYDIHGRPVQHEIKDRVICVPLEEIKRIPLRIGGATGDHKVMSIIGALRGGYINALVTDEQTATGVLRFSENGRDGSPPLP